MLEIQCPATYPKGCKIVICGEAPGADEVREKEGFVGDAGKILDKTLFVSGIDRSKIGLTNVSKRAPRGGFDSEHFIEDFYETVRPEVVTEKVTKRCVHCGRTEKQHAKKQAPCQGFEPIVARKVKLGKKVTRPTEELQAYIGLLRDELVSVRPNVVVAAGNQALRALCGIEGITKYRGSILPCTLVPGLKVVPILHPSWIQRSAQWQEIWITGQIFARKVLPQSKSPELEYATWNEYLHPTIEEVERYVKDCKEAPYYTLDIETRAGSIACIGLCYGDVGNEFAICVPIQTTKGPYFTPEMELHFWRLLQELLDSNPNLVGQNIFYDLAWLREYGIRPTGVHDTMLLFHRMYPEVEKGLDFLCMLYTNIPYYKDDGKTWAKSVPDERLWSYNCLTPDTRVLTAELEWVPLNNLFGGYVKTGKCQDLIGLDEYGQSGRRKLRRSNVQRMWKVKKPCLRIDLEDGRSVIASTEHPWLVRRNKCDSGYQWMRSDKVRPGMSIAHLGTPWNTDNSRDGGWLAGMYDGEGCVSKWQVSLSQKAGPVLDEVITQQKAMGLHARASVHKGHGTVWSVVNCNVVDSLRLLGSLRPIRLLPKASKIWEGRYPFQGHKPVKVMNVSEVGHRWVIGLSTSTNTFFAEGLATHNCKDIVSTLRVWNALLAERGHDKAKELYFSHTQKIMPVAFEMQSLGMDVAPDGWFEAREVINAELDKIRGRLAEETNGVLVIKPDGKKITDQAKAAWLYDVMKLPRKFNKKTKKPTVEEDALVELMISPKTTPEQRTTLQLVLAESKFSKAMNSYIDVDYCEQEIATPWVEND